MDPIRFWFENLQNWKFFLSFLLGIFLIYRVTRFLFIMKFINLQLFAQLFPDLLPNLHSFGPVRVVCKQWMPEDPIKHCSWPEVVGENARTFHSSAYKRRSPAFPFDLRRTRMTVAADFLFLVAHEEVILHATPPPTWSNQPILARFATPNQLCSSFVISAIVVTWVSQPISHVYLFLSRSVKRNSPFINWFLLISLSTIP